MEIEKKFLLRGPEELPGKPDHTSQIEQFYLDPAKCRMEGQSLMVDGARPIHLEGPAAGLIPSPFSPTAIIRLRRHHPVRPGRPPIVLCFKWDPAAQRSGAPHASPADGNAETRPASSCEGDGISAPKERPRASAAVSEEHEFPIYDEGIWEALLPAIQGVPIQKKRHDYGSLIPGRLVELDVFEGALAGLVVAEVEFPSLEEVARFEESLPPFFRRAKDVSADRRYSNRVLGLRGLPA